MNKIYIGVDSYTWEPKIISSFVQEILEDLVVLYTEELSINLEKLYDDVCDCLRHVKNSKFKILNGIVFDANIYHYNDNGITYIAFKADVYQNEEIVGAKYFKNTENREEIKDIENIKEVCK